MKNKKKLAISITAVTFFPLISWAYTPNITLEFEDPQKLCTVSGKTQFALNYKYVTDTGYEFFSGPVQVNNNPQKISVPTPATAFTSYVDFEITDQGECGEMDLDYFDLGSCYLTDLIPHQDQNFPYSYQITIKPQATGHSTYGRPMYNLACTVAVR